MLNLHHHECKSIDKCIDSRENVHVSASTNVPFTLKKVQVPNLPLTHTKRITVYKSDLTDYLLEHVQESLLSSASSRTSSPGEEDRMQHTMDISSSSYTVIHFE